MNIVSLSEDRVVATIQPPVFHAKGKPKPITLDVQSDCGGILLEPFRIEDDLPETTYHIVGGVLIYVDDEPSIVLVCSEFPMYNPPDYSNYQGIGSRSYLLKADPRNQNIVIEHPDAIEGDTPHVLQNEYYGIQGLLLQGHKVFITNEDGMVSIKRDPQKRR